MSPQLPPGASVLLNGDAEAPRRLGPALRAAGQSYLAAERLAAAWRPASLSDSLGRARAGLAFAWRSFWGGFGWLAIWPGPAALALAALLTAFAGLALALALVRPALLAEDEAGRRFLRLCGFAALLSLALALVGTMAGAGPDRLPQGRYLLPAAPAWIFPAVALADRAWRRRGAWLLAALMLALDLWMVLGLLWPAFRAP